MCGSSKASLPAAETAERGIDGAACAEGPENRGNLLDRPSAAASAGRETEENLFLREET